MSCPCPYRARTFRWPYPAPRARACRSLARSPGAVRPTASASVRSPGCSAAPCASPASSGRTRRAAGRCRAPNTPDAARGSGSRRWRWRVTRGRRAMQPAAIASSKIASAKPCQLVSPPATRWRMPGSRDALRAAPARSTSAISQAGVGAAALVGDHAQFVALGAERAAWCAGSCCRARPYTQAVRRIRWRAPLARDGLLARELAVRRRRPAARWRSSSRYGRVPLPSKT